MELRSRPGISGSQTKPRATSEGRKAVGTNRIKSHNRFLLYTNGIHSLLALHLPGISLEYDILTHVARIFDIHQVYIRYILHIMEITTYHWINIIWMVLRGILISLHFITV